MFLRSAKVISVGAAFCVIGFYFINADRRYSGKTIWKGILYAFIFSLLCTIDEQIIGVMVILGGLSVLHSAFKREVTGNTYIFVGSIVFYFIFYFTWGRILCAYFTPVPLQQHPHNMGKMVYFYKYLWDGAKMYAAALLRLVWNNRILLCVLLLLWIAGIVMTKNLESVITSFYLFASGLAFSIMIVTQHPIIASLEEQPKGLYYNIVICWALTSFLYTLSKQQFNKIPQLFYCFVFFLPMLNLVFVQLHIEEYEVTHATQGGEFIDSFGRLTDFLNSDEAKAMGVKRQYFDGLLVSPSECEEYMKKIQE